MITLATPRSPEELNAVRGLMREYAQAIGVDLCFQGFDAEVAALPGEYRAPRGALLTAHVAADLAGCCALRPLDNVDYPNACEMKRLYVRGDYRGRGVGRLLVEAKGTADLVGRKHVESPMLHFVHRIERGSRRRVPQVGIELGQQFAPLGQTLDGNIRSQRKLRNRKISRVRILQHP